MQYFATSNVPFSPTLSDPQDEESGNLADEGTGSEIEPGDSTPVPHDGMVGQFDWDDMLPESSEQEAAFSLRRETPYPSLLKSSESPTLISGETTPLLRKAVSFTDAVHPRRLSSVNKVFVAENLGTAASAQSNYQSIEPVKGNLPRRSSAQTLRYSYGGKSTYGQTVGVF